MRTKSMRQYHAAQLAQIERRIAQGWRRVDIAAEMGLTDGRVGALVRELKNAGRIDPLRPDQAAAYREFARVLFSVERERKLTAVSPDQH